MAEPEAVLLTVEAILIERNKTAAKQRADTERSRPGRRAPGRRT
jgi:hypothetical protein